MSDDDFGDDLFDSDGNIKVAKKKKNRHSSDEEGERDRLLSKDGVKKNALMDSNKLNIEVPRSLAEDTHEPRGELLSSILPQSERAKRKEEEREERAERKAERGLKSLVAATAGDGDGDGDGEEGRRRRRRKGKGSDTKAKTQKTKRRRSRRRESGSDEDSDASSSSADMASSDDEAEMNWPDKGIDMTLPRHKIKRLRVLSEDFILKSEAHNATRPLVAIIALTTLEFGDDSLELARAHVQLAQCYSRHLKLHAQALVHGQRAREVWDACPQNVGVDEEEAGDEALEFTAQLYALLGTSLGAAKKYKAAEQALRKAAEAARRLGNRHADNEEEAAEEGLVTEASCLLNIGRMHARREGKHAAAYAEKAMGALEEAARVAGKSEAMAGVCLEMGRIQEREGDRSLALDMYEKAYKLFRKHETESAREGEADAAQATATLLVANEEDERAEKYLQGASTWCRTSLGREHERTLLLQEEHCRLFVRQEEYGQAARVGWQVMEAKSIAFGDHTVQMADSYKLMGSIRMAQKKRDVANKYYTKAYYIYRNNLGESHKKTLALAHVVGGEQQGKEKITARNRVDMRRSGGGGGGGGGRSSSVASTHSSRDSDRESNFDDYDTDDNKGYRNDDTDDDDDEDDDEDDDDE